MCDTEEAHLAGMLDRDQRTVRTRHPQPASYYRGDYVVEPCWSDAPSCRSYERRTRQARPIWKILQRLKRVLVLGVYLLSVVHIPRTSCAPAYNMDSRPKWINPCGMTADIQQVSEGSEVTDKDLLNQIVVQARIAHTEADNFKDEYVQKTFNMDFDQHHKHWKTQRYDWLPNKEQIPKNLGEKTPQDHLDGLELDKSLLDVYEYLQILAVGLEQIAWDQQADHAPFLNKFRALEFKLQLLLCEIQGAIIERGLDMRADIQRDIMGQEYRDNRNMSSRYLRDWLIFRDYMNALEYVIEVFEHFKSSL